MKKVIPISFSFLVFLLYVLGICVPWFEYTVTWDPPAKVFSMENSGYYSPQYLSITHEHPRFFQQGPGSFPPLFKRKVNGCYVAGNCSGCDGRFHRLSRLHISLLTSYEVLLIRLFHTFGFLGLLTSIGMVIWTGICRLSGYTRVFYMLAAFLTFCLTAILVLAILGPAIGNLYLDEKLPWWGECSTVPPVVVCEGLSAISIMRSIGEATWELEGILPVGPLLATAPFTFLAVQVTRKLRLR
jgi:hypothetical protein